MSSMMSLRLPPALALPARLRALARDGRPRVARFPLARAALVAGVAALALLLAGAPPAGAQQAAGKGRIKGTIEGAPAGVKLEGTRVVLVRLKLDAEGKPSGEPIQSQMASADGKYTFSDVPIEPRTVFQVGAQVDGQMVGSQPFTFPEGTREVMLDLRVPKLVTDASVVHGEEGLIVVEPHRGGVWVTEVLHLNNASDNVVEGVQHPIELTLSADADKLEMIREIQDRNGHERLGDKLLIFGNVNPGRTTVAFRYQLPVWLGTVELTKRYPFPIRLLSVLTPQEGRLRLTSAGFSVEEPKTLGSDRFQNWAAKDIAAQQVVTVRLTGVPVRQQIFLIPAGGFAALMIGIVLWFLRRRLRPGTAGESA